MEKYPHAPVAEGPVTRNERLKIAGEHYIGRLLCSKFDAARTRITLREYHIAQYSDTKADIEARISDALDKLDRNEMFEEILNTFKVTR